MRRCFIILGCLLLSAPSAHAVRLRIVNSNGDTVTNTAPGDQVLNLTIIAITEEGDGIEGSGWYGGSGMDVTHNTIGSAVVALGKDDVTIGRVFDDTGTNSTGSDLKQVRNLVFATLLQKPGPGANVGDEVIIAELSIHIGNAQDGDIIVLSLADVVAPSEALASTQIDNGKVLVSERTTHTVSIVTSVPPALVQIADGLGGINAATGLLDTFISPLGEDQTLSRFSFEANEPLTLNGVVSTYTGPGTVPSLQLVDLGNGRHAAVLTPPPLPGHWFKARLAVTGKTSGRNSEMTIWVAHQPLDINQDGVSNIRDATAFGVEFRGDARTALIDLNGDGNVDVRDATAFGFNWVGNAPATRNWSNTALPAKP